MTQLTVQLPESLKETAEKLAARDNVSIDELIVRMLDHAARLEAAWEERVARGRKVTQERALEILRKAPNVPPMPGDEIPE